MKIAILTQPLKSNYGGILQAFALQRVLKHLGHESIVLNRDYGNSELFVLLYRIGSFIKCCLKKYILRSENICICNPLTKGVYRTSSIKRYDEALSLFINNNIVRTNPIYSTRRLKREFEKVHFDCIIVGSDQVWREKYSPCITNYFLDFLSDNKDVKKISYAASFGTNDGPISANELQKCISLLRQFDSISIRESSGVQYIRDIFQRRSDLVLDPTLLLKQDDYMELIENKDLKDSGIVSYILDSNDEKKAIVSDLRECLGVNYTDLFIDSYDAKGNHRELKSISKWLSSILMADFVVTDSFHGCVFAIIFQKKFIAIGNKERGLERFTTLLGDFSISERLITSLEDYKSRRDDLLKSSINYRKIELIHEQLRERSISFLIKALT